MTMIASIAAALILPTAGTAVAQPAPIRHESIERLLHQTRFPEARPAQDDDVETIEVANPFTADDDAAPKVVRDVSGGQLSVGSQDLPQFTNAPAPDGAPQPKGAVGLAFSMKLGGR